MIAISNTDVRCIVKAIEEYVSIKPKDNGMKERQRMARLVLKKVKKKQS